MSDQNPAQVLEALATAVANNQQADVLVYNGAVQRPHDDRVIDACVKLRRRKNVFLILTTFGGDANAAFRIARALQEYYDRFTIFVPGFCKSAGTLIALGAHEVVLAKHSELGPLDVQVLKYGEVGERSSGLTPTDALLSLNSQALQAFTACFKALRFEMQMTTRMAAETATSLVSGIYRGVYEQVDPMRLGELERTLRITAEYGRRLIEHSKNATPDALAKLVNGYPAHNFVIDQMEARSLFTRVRQPTKEESQLESYLEMAIRVPIETDSGSLVRFISKELEGVNNVEPELERGLGGNSESSNGKSSPDAPAAGSTSSEPPENPSG